MNKLLSLLFFCFLFSSNVVTFAHSHDKIEQIKFQIQNTTDQVEIAKLQLELGWMLKYEDLDKFHSTIKSSLGVFKANHDEEGLAIAHSYLGVYYYLNSQIAQAIDQLNIAEKMFKEQHNDVRLAKVYSNLGTAYAALYDNSKALDYYNQSLEIRKQNPDSSSLSSSLINISTIYYDQGKYEECIHTNEQALVLALQRKEYEETAIIYSNLGAAHERLGNFQKSVNYTLKALELYQSEVNNDLAKTRTYSNLGAAYMSQNKLDEARYYFNMALEMSAQLTNKRQHIVSLNNMSELERKNLNLTKARTFALSALEYAEEMSYWEEKMISLDELHLIENDAKNYEKALQYYKDYIHLSDSLIEISQTQESQLALIQHEMNLNNIMQEKESQLENIKQKKLDIMTMVLWVTLFVFSVWIIIYLAKQPVHPYVIQSIHVLIPLCATYASGLYIFLETNLVTERENWVVITVLLSSTFIGILVHILLNHLYQKRIKIESNN
ncbi:tetratricopeptide repeat protein [bacterium SCSIO 12643]|nr:tetratricopeptide repeat protein [bacterium SCSIO 12643]